MLVKSGSGSFAAPSCQFPHMFYFVEVADTHLHCPVVGTNIIMLGNFNECFLD